MIKISADFNFYEQRHNDLLKSNQLFINNIYMELKNGHKDLTFKSNLNKSLGIRQSLLEPKKDKKDKEKDIFYEIVKSKEFRGPNNLMILDIYHNDCMIIYNNICEKIKFDHIIRPFRIFWIKSEYKLLNQIITLIFGGLVMYIKYVIQDFEQIFKGMTT